MNEKELVEAAISILHDSPCKDATLMSDRQVAPVSNLDRTAVSKVSNNQYILLHQR